MHASSRHSAFCRGGLSCCAVIQMQGCRLTGCKKKQKCTSYGRSVERDSLQEALLAPPEPEGLSRNWCMSEMSLNVARL